jgi:hypothetical protein
MLDSYPDARMKQEFSPLIEHMQEKDVSQLYDILLRHKAKIADSERAHAQDLERIKEESARISETFGGF